MKVTIRDIARLSDVSVTTVSQIVNNKGHRFSKRTKDKVLKVIEENNYTPNYFASNIIKNKSCMIGVIMPTMNDPFTYSIVRKMRPILGKSNYHILISESFGEEEMELELLEKYHQLAVEAILIFTSHKLPQDLFKKSVYRGTPVIFIDNGLNKSYFGDIFLSEYQSIYDSVSYLIKKGHQKIGLIKDRGETFSFTDRKQAYLDALSDNKLIVDSTLIKEVTLSIEAGYQATTEILKEKEVTAILCCDDNIPIGCYQSIYDSGKVVNRDIEIIGFDGIEFLKQMRPKIKTMHTPFEEFAEILSQKIIRAIEYPKEPQDTQHLEMSFKIND
ncbi:MAG: LacI family DNA-binding transcriptional regulator [Vagococcus sp.]|uniref:LacI family DNA-binding transcriptional regulator n=1 Tax=Vagococcus sp. TaxID=1933889 RepID=UPI002FCB3ECA